MDKSEVLKITDQYGLAPTKKFGQNFLINDDLIKKILKFCNPEGKKVLEIGPGLGAISRGLSESAESYTAVEIDAGFFRYLSDLFAGRDNVRLIHGDYLKLALDEQFPLVVSNLPYYCASEILFKIANETGADDLFIMVQKEMAERMASKPGVSEYGAMTVTLSFYYDIKLLFHVGGECFYPRPEVKSSFLHLKRIDRGYDDKFRELFHLVVKAAFWGRRKTLLKSISSSPHMKISRSAVEEALESSGIDSFLRAENLGIDEFIKLTQAIGKR